MAVGEELELVFGDGPAFGGFEDFEALGGVVA